MSDAMDAVQDLVLIELEQMQARRLAQVQQLPVPNLRLRAVYCAECGERIDPRRVRAQPGCTRCVECERMSERRASRR